MGGVIAVAGSRVLSAAGAELVAETAEKMISFGCSLAVGHYHCLYQFGWWRVPGQ